MAQRCDRSTAPPHRRPRAAPADAGRFQEVDLYSIEMVCPRSVGIEYAALSAVRQCGFEDTLAEFGFNRPHIAAAVVNLIGRTAHPGSELATNAWLKKRSELGEFATLYDLTNTNFEGIAAGIQKAMCAVLRAPPCHHE